MGRGNGEVKLAVFPWVDFNTEFAIAQIEGAGLDAAVCINDQVGSVVENWNECLGRVLGVYGVPSCNIVVVWAAVISRPV